MQRYTPSNYILHGRFQVLGEKEVMIIHKILSNYKLAVVRAMEYKEKIDNEESRDIDILGDRLQIINKENDRCGLAHL